MLHQLSELKFTPFQVGEFVRLVGVRTIRRIPPSPEEHHSRGLRHTRSRDATSISHHYDVSNDFYTSCNPSVSVPGGKNVPCACVSVPRVLDHLRRAINSSIDPLHCAPHYQYDDRASIPLKVKTDADQVAEGRASGKVSVKVAPRSRPGEETSRSPRCARARERAIVRPIPAPPGAERSAR